MAVKSKRSKIVSVLATMSVVTTLTLGVTPVSAANPQLIVDLGTVTKPTVDHAGAGALYGLRFDHVPDDRGLAPLNFKMLAQPPANPGMLPNGEVRPFGDATVVSHEAVRNGIKQIQIYMSDTYPNFPQHWVSWSDYLSRVDGEVTAVLNSPYKNLFTYIPWNEPDWTWNNPNSTGVDFNTGFKMIVDRIKTQDTVNLIEGPNTAVYNHDSMLSFLTYCKANNCLPDIISWHELDNTTLPKFDATVADLRAIETSLGIAHRPIAINEYIQANQLGKPGLAVQYLAKFERNNVDTASLPFWNMGGTLGDIFTNQYSVPNGNFWLYKFYADMSGSMVQVTPPTPTVMGLDGVASRDDNKQQETIVFGGGTGAADIVVKGLTATSYLTGSVHAQIWKTIDTGSTSTKLTSPIYVSDGEYPIVNGQVTIPMTNMASNDGYQMVITPSTPGAVNTNNRYEAEYAQLSGTATVKRDHSGYSGTGFVAGFDFSNNAKARFVVSMANDGMYTSTLRYSAGPHTNNVNRIVGLYVNGKKVKDIPLTATTDWNTWANASENLFLLEGINTIEYRAETTNNNDTINLDYIDVAPSTSVTVYQAENATLGGTAVVATNHSGYNGTGFVAGYDNSTTASTTFNVNVASAGSYNIALRYSAGEQYPQGWADNRTVGLYVNGVKIKDVTLLGTVTWNLWNEDVQTLNLQAGNNTIAYKAELSNNDDSINLDQISVYANPQVKLEAESASLTSGAAVVTDHPYYSGSGFVTGFGATNAAATFNYSAASAGTYQLSLHYAAGTDPSQLNWSFDRTVGLYVNNTKVQDWTLPGTGSWDDWKDAVTQVALPAGNNTIEIKADRTDNNDVINLDYVFLNKQP